MSKLSSFRVSCHPVLKRTSQPASEWDWLYNVPIQKWEDMVQANLDDQGESADLTVFYVLKPMPNGEEEALECPGDVALRIYEDVLTGKRAPTTSINNMIKKVITAGGNRIRPSKQGAESYY